MELHSAAPQPPTTIISYYVCLCSMHAKVRRLVPSRGLKTKDHAFFYLITAVARPVRTFDATGRGADRMLRSSQPDSLDRWNWAPSASCFIGGLSNDVSQL